MTFGRKFERGLQLMVESIVDEIASRGNGDLVRELIRFEADRAQAWFESGLKLLPLLDRQSAACVGAMAGIYRRLLGRIERRPVAQTFQTPAGARFTVRAPALITASTTRQR